MLLTQAEPHDPHRSRFVVYRRIDADAIPPPAELDARTDVLGYFATRTGIAVHFHPGAGALTAVELRVRAGPDCNGNDLQLVRDDGRIVATGRRPAVVGVPIRYTLAFPAQSGSAHRAYEFRVEGCALALDPPQPLRRRAIVFGSPKPPVARPQEALRAFIDPAER